MKVFIAVVTTESGEVYTIPFEHNPCKKDIKFAFNNIGDESWNDVANYDVYEEETIK
jgi:hypothetical protein